MTWLVPSRVWRRGVQAANMPDESSITREAVRIVGDATVETAWFKFLNKSQLGDPCLMNLKCNGPIECVAYSPDGRKIDEDGYLVEDD